MEKTNTMKRQPTGWEEILANRLSEKGSFPKYISNSDSFLAK